MRAHEHDHLSANVEPRGDVQFLEAAIDLLKPLRPSDRTLRPWERQLWGLPDPDLPPVPERENARRQLIDIAVEFNLGLESQASAPTTAGVLEQLKLLGERARDLGRTIHALDPYALRAIELCIEEPDTIPGIDAARVRAVCERAQAHGIEDSTLAFLLRGRAVVQDSWLDRLDALVELTMIARRLGTERYGTGDVSRPDAGGRAKLDQRFNPNPVWSLAVDAAAIFDRCRPGDLSASLRGPFDEFVCLLYQFATGKDAEDNRAQLEWRIQKVARLIRRARSIDAELLRLQERRRHRHEAAVSPAEATEIAGQIKALATQLMAVVEELSSGKDPAKEPPSKNRG